MNLSRRRFLALTGASVAAAALPSPVKAVTSGPFVEAASVNVTLPAPLIPCDGRRLARADYPDLARILMDRYGGDETHFRVPNMSYSIPPDGIGVHGVIVIAGRSIDEDPEIGLHIPVGMLFEVTVCS